MEMSYSWNFQQLAGYLNTWSAVKHYERQRGYNPVDSFMEELKEAWGGEENKTVAFPLIGRWGKVS